MIDIPRKLLGILLMAGVASSAQATLSEPDHILYGTVTWFGEEVAAGTVVSLTLGGQSTPLVSYTMGSDPQLSGLYGLRVPMDSVDPRSPGTARPGEAATIHIADTLAAEISIGPPGSARRLDLDPGNLTGFPNLSVQDLQVAEGSSGGITTAAVVVSISTNSPDPVTFNWAAADGTAVAGSCDAGGDFIAASGNGTIPSGSLSTEIEIEICGDTTIESDENFRVFISNVAQANAADLDALVTIMDDDDMPTLTVADIVALEPTAGSSLAQFTLSLSQVASEAVSVTYTTSDGSAVAGSDYQAAAGTLVIPAGNPTGTIEVTVLADAEVEETETFLVSFSDVLGAGLGTAAATASIVDPAFDPSVEPVGTLVDGDGIDGLSGAGALMVTRDDSRVLVAGRSEDKLAQLLRNNADGMLSFETVYQATEGFADALFDGMSDLLQSADGQWVFIVSAPDAAVGIFERTATGIEHRANSALALTSMAGATSAALSPDGKHLYVAAQTAGAINVFAFDPVAPSLALIESETDGVDDPNDAGAAVNGLAGAASVVVSSDGRSVYVAGRFDNALALFDRDFDPASSTFGQLSFRQAYLNNVAGVQGLGSASQLAISSEGGSVYVVGQASNSLAAFVRDRSTGLLSFQRAFFSGTDSLFGMDFPSAIRISRDGWLLVVAGFEDDTLVLFDRQAVVEHPDFGQLTLADIRRNGEGGLTVMDGPADIDFSQDDGYIYISASTGSSVTALKRFPRGDTVFGGGFE